MTLIGGLLMEDSIAAITYPLVLGGGSIIACVIGTFFVKAREGGKIMNALYRGLIVSGVIAAGLFDCVTDYFMGNNGTYTTMQLFASAMIGLGLTAAMVVITEYYTSTHLRTR